MWSTWRANRGRAGLAGFAVVLLQGPYSVRGERKGTHQAQHPNAHTAETHFYWPRELGPVSRHQWILPRYGILAVVRRGSHQNTTFSGDLTFHMRRDAAFTRNSLA
ncbi:hypothetical protein BKA65DRAFT_244340 [Rhexocercosporidium sp. MPI-PUGE-AT-0058]|nr:hypothetical protein BKA65DRAFT_244340 [Rhexocercosporidium sp. MPI-PUGE-AT-0058]